MNKKIIALSVVSFLVLMFVVIPPLKVAVMTRISNDAYVTSTHAKYCYPKGHINSNIKVRIAYPTLESCGKPLRS